jgi:hypothetical protein
MSAGDEDVFVPLIYSLGPLVLWETLVTGYETRDHPLPGDLWLIDLCWHGWTLLRGWLDRFAWRTATTTDFQELVRDFEGAAASDYLAQWLAQ